MTTRAPSKKLTTAIPGTVDTDLQSFLARLEQKTVKSFEEKTAVLAAVAEVNTVKEAAVPIGPNEGTRPTLQFDV